MRSRRVYFISLLITSLFLLTACSREDKAVVELLDRADSLLRVNPDSALKILSPLSHSPSLSSPPLGEVGRGLGMKSRMRYQLLLADALNKTDRPMPSDTVMQEVVDYYDRHGNANERMRAHYLLGRVYHDMGEAPQALECYQQAAELADTTSADCDLHVLHLIYGQMADLYYFQYLPDDEMQALKNCERIAWKEHDSLPALKAYELRFRPYYQKNDTDSILYYLNKSFQRYRKYGYYQEAANVLGMRLSIYLDQHQLNKASIDRRIFRGESGLFDSSGDILRGREIRYYDEGRYQLGIGHQDSALYWFNRVLSYGYTEAGYKGLLDLYKQKKIPDSIAKYAELFAKANDDSYLENSMELVSKQTQLYNYQRNQKIAVQKEQELAQMQLYALYIAIVIVCASMILYIIHLKNKSKRRLLINSLTEKYHSVLSEKRQISDNVKSLEDLCETITQDRQDLRRKMAEQIAIYQRRLEAEESEIVELQNQLQSYKSHELVKNFIESEIGRYFMNLRKIQTKLKLPTEREWDKLEGLIRVCSPELSILMKRQKSLSNKEKHVLFLLLIGYQSKEIASIWEISYSNISNICSRINSKLFKGTDSRSLKDNISSFYIKK